MIKTVIYLHGYNSCGVSDKSDALIDALASDVVVMRPNLPMDSEKAHALICDLVKNTDGYVVLVGTSLGGFYVTSVGEWMDVPYIAVNPAMHPGSGTLKDFPEVNPSYLCKLEEELYNNPARDSPSYYVDQCNVFLAKDDDVLDYMVAYDKFKCKKNVVVTEDGGHRYSSNWNLVINRVKELLGS